MPQLWDKEHGKRLVAFGCGSHVLNLFCSDIGKIGAVTELIASMKGAMAFQRSQLPSALFDEERARLGIKCGLVSEAPTRFGTHVLVSRALLDCKPALQALVVHERWPTSAVCNEAKKSILSDEFWADVMQFTRKLQQGLYGVSLHFRALLCSRVPCVLFQSPDFYRHAANYRIQAS